LIHLVLSDNMNFKAFIIFIFLHLSFIGSFSQLLPFDQKITFNYKDVPLKDVLNSITIITGVRFSYSPKKIPESALITANFANTPLNKVLDEIFSSLPVKYELIDNYIVLKKGMGNVVDAEKEINHFFTFCGYIKDAKTGEYLPGAAIYIKEKEMSVIANNYGFFSVTVTPAKYTISVSYIGYENTTQVIDLLSNTKFDFKLNDLPKRLEEVIISNIKKEELNFRMFASQSEILPSFVKKQPSLLGESDVIKALEFQPGISFYGDGSTYFNVRGGNYDQNLILLDEATIYNPSHLLGLFSPIIPEAVQNVDIYKADYPVYYGGRLSSIIDIRTKDGNKNNFSGSGSMGIISLKTSFEGPIKKDASSFFVAFRRSYFDLFLKSAIPNLVALHFYDFTTKVNFRLGSNDRLFFTFYKGNDVFRNKTGDTDTSGVNWGNTSATLRWNHTFGSRFFTNTTFYISKYEYYLYNSLENNTYWNSSITNTSLKHDLSFYATPKITWRCGMKIDFFDFNPGNYYTPQTADKYQVSPVKSTQISFYAGAEHEITERIKLNYGLRVNSWKNKGEALVQYYNPDYSPDTAILYTKDEVFYKQQSLEPRLSVSIRTGKYTSLKTCYSRTTQYINLITNSISPFSSMEVWMPAGPNIKPQSADIIDLGYIKSFPKNKITITTDIYYKWLYHQIGYVNQANMLVNKYIEGELRQGNGWAYGFEFSVLKEIGKFNGQLSYTYSRTFLQIADLNDGKSFPATFDRPHNFNLSLLFEARPRWLISCNFNISSGHRITTPTSFFYYKGSQVPEYSNINNDHMPPYSRLDLSTTIRLNKLTRKYNHSLTISIYNAYGQQNPIFINFNKMETNDGKYEVPTDKINNPEITSTMRYTFWMIPSISYNFNF
jgi:hypothetical protein